MDSWRKVRDSLSALGFYPVAVSEWDAFHGKVKIGRVEVSLELRFRDYEFLEPPKVYVLDTTTLPKSLSGHVLTDGSLCYADRATLLLDRYQPDRSAASVVELAKKTLYTLLHGNPTPEVMAELAAYWGGAQYVLIDAPKSLKTATLGVIDFGRNHSLLAAAGNELRLKKWASKAGGKASAFSSYPVIHCDVPLNRFEGDLTFGGALRWVAAHMDDPSHLRDLVRPKKKDLKPGLLVSGPNAIIGFRAKEPAIIKRAKQGGFRPASILELWFQHEESIEIDRFSFDLCSMEEVSARNLNRAAPLAGKKVALIGCGTIGGYLARALVQLGAGQAERFLIIDDDILKPENTGRHLLGARFLYRPKSSSLAELLETDFPSVSVTAISGNATTQFERLSAYDIVVDATGDQQFSDAINAHAIQAQRDGSPFPPILFTMIFGNGLAAQSYLARWIEGGACYRCLRPKFDGRWRYGPIKQNGPETQTAVRPCSQGAFTPFSVAASHACAALATQHVSDYFEKGYTGDLRTVRVAYEGTSDVPRRNVKAIESCPACGASGSG
ncbi:ThiF family adenylyltransferase [Leisingera sp. D0M16]|uniref:ThiF family adenylyltransferase n=1 Tax=Leisingera coralii TaxID=3351347 RepID=UPI003B7960EB